ncbi:WD40/YVTN/BNR-like repeat-containing protein [Pseudomonas brassicacearum]|uniref:Glycosyl hydrolase n=1 Tax=Pseudomonas brassicacearum TaxID=930166 RepID=A0AAJ3KW53_9PSED|nr:YCF48-related protein [Pseudomonas brassicacearum]NUT81931.1 glycosyl hydrolase [Pseudomonas brassicacearum]QGA50332.1 glycosyl hydrolase [Pseudomonas brassicacearum]
MNVEKNFAQRSPLWGVFALVASLLMSVPLVAQATTLAVLQQPALPTAKAQRAVLLGLARAGERLVAVGERGIVLLSDDAGMSWRQAKVPVSVSLTAVQFVDAEQGWAVGHLGVVLHTQDGGQTWQKQLDGERAIALAVQVAERDADQPGGASHLAQARRLLEDGPDKPFLDLYFSDRLHGYVVGAYNQIYRTDDGGRSWQPWMRHVDNPQGLNLYGIRALGNDLWLVGERGLLLRSTDAGQSFQALKSPYEGSFFGLLGTRDGALVVYGLRGNAWWSGDRGNSWRRLDTGIESTLASALELRDGGLLLASQSGELLFSHDQGRSFDKRQSRSGGTVAAVQQAVDGSLASVGLTGVAADQDPRAAGQP